MLLARAEDALLEREAENNLPLGLLGNAARGEMAVGPEALFLCFDDGAPRGVALRAGSDRIVLSRAEPDALDAVVAWLRGHGVMLSGVCAENETARGFADRWSTVTHLRSSVSVRQRLYQATAVTAPTSPASGVPRLARPEEDDWVAEGIVAFEREATEVVRAPAVALAIARARIERGQIWVWEDGGRPVSMAARSRRTRTGECVNLVWTPPSRRKNGYATSLVAALTARILDDGAAFACLYTDLANPTSNAIYQRIGYVPVVDARVIAFVTSAY